ncbi:hypothetical protein Cch01nite_27960 [Cellulomonas chitinilytica]|uniref:DNA ligase (ATP) n=1 Tax=Cellulomonas chitinilytica TaxID=398759 RepID=A0A919U336_9CELL|nr:non-homologous end-joining DNA ligase [Cellulomonas chitinilytica]GIG22072.1 hypothetical protein Cch01nite_27960 [Cellulomonas chitinilytica]
MPERRERLAEYRAKRDLARTPEPVPAADQVLPTGDGSTFVVQEHHARALHWDVRLERDGVLVSWAVPKGLPQDPGTNHLAVHTEDHPLEYATFEGRIGAGEYGGGQVTIWDRGTYETLKWEDREVQVVLHGERVEGRYVFFATSTKGRPDDGRSWMVHRMDPPARDDWTPLPDLVRPMLATPGELPEDDDGWAFEMKWDGVRAVAYVDGGRVRLMSRNDLDVTRSYPEIAGLGEQLGSVQAVLDGELVTFDERGAPHFGRLQQRMHVQDPAAARRLAKTVPVVYLVFDVLHLDGRPTVDLPYDERRALLDGLGLAGRSWQTPPSFDGPGADVLAASRENGLEGVVAKRRTGRYRPGSRSPDWRKVKHVRMQEVVVVGWRPGKGARAETLGALVLGVHDGGGVLRPAGSVGTGFTRRMLDELLARLRPLEVAGSPFEERLPGAETRDVHWVRPQVVGEVAFAEWTSDGRLRHPSWRGLRPDKAVTDVVRES